METWRNVWREGAAPLLPTKGLEALKDALIHDNTNLIQGATTTPPPLHCVEDWPVEAACALGYCGWMDGLHTVKEVEEFFSRMCYEIDQRIDERAGCRHFLNTYDNWTREEMRTNLLPEVELELAKRAIDDSTRDSTDPGRNGIGQSGGFSTSDAT